MQSTYVSCLLEEQHMQWCMCCWTVQAQQQRAAYQLGRGDAAISLLIQICKCLLDVQLSLGRQQSQTHQVTGRTPCTCLSKTLDHRCSAPAAMVRFHLKHSTKKGYGDSHHIPKHRQCHLQKADKQLKLTVLASQQHNAGLYL